MEPLVNYGFDLAGGGGRGTNLLFPERAEEGGEQNNPKEDSLQLDINAKNKNRYLHNVFRMIFFFFLPSGLSASLPALNLGISIYTNDAT